jgi:hypothetical protein
MKPFMKRAGPLLAAIGTACFGFCFPSLPVVAQMVQCEITTESGTPITTESGTILATEQDACEPSARSRRTKQTESGLAPRSSITRASITRGSATRLPQHQRATLKQQLHELKALEPRHNDVTLLSAR